MGGLVSQNPFGSIPVLNELLDLTEPRDIHVIGLSMSAIAAP